MPVEKAKFMPLDDPLDIDDPVMAAKSRWNPLNLIPEPIDNDGLRPPPIEYPALSGMALTTLYSPPIAILGLVDTP